MKVATLLLIVLALAACGGGDDGEGSESGPVRVELSPRGSGPSGTATLTGTDDQSFTIALSLDPSFEGIGSHIHNISCADYTDAKGPETIFVDIGPVVDGKAANSATLPLESVQKDGYSINVHSNDPPYNSVACGDIPVSG